MGYRYIVNASRQIGVTSGVPLIPTRSASRTKRRPGADQSTTTTHGGRGRGSRTRPPVPFPVLPEVPMDETPNDDERRDPRGSRSRPHRGGFGTEHGRGFGGGIGPGFGPGGPGFRPGTPPRRWPARWPGRPRRCPRGGPAAARDRADARLEPIQRIQDKTGGLWVPSPGSIYPALQQLEDEGLVAFDRVEGRKTATLTDSGKAYVEEHRAELAPPGTTSAAGSAARLESCAADRRADGGRAHGLPGRHQGPGQPGQ